MDLTYPPFESKSASGEPEGVSVEIAKALADHLDRPLQIEALPFDGLIPALKTGKIDLILSSMTANEKRRKSIDFSDPYVRTGLAMLVPADSDVQGFDDLLSSDRRVAVRLGTTGEMFAKDRLPDTKLTVLDQDASCVLEVVNGRVDAYIYDQLSIFRYHQKHPETTRALLEPLLDEFWAIGIAKGSDDLRSAVNAFLADYRASGAFDELGYRFLKEEKAMLEKMGIPFLFEQ